MCHVIPVCHKSGGPLYDFKQFGICFYNNQYEICNEIIRILSKPLNEFSIESRGMYIKAKKVFSRDRFINDFKSILYPLQLLKLSKW